MPKELRILGKTFKISLEKLTEENRSFTGSWDGNLQKIMIRSSIHKEQQEEALLHETLHVLSSELVLEISEDTIRKLSPVLYQVLKDNPKWW